MDRYTFISSGNANQISSTLASLNSQFLFFLESIQVTTGAYISIQAQSLVGSWFEIDSRNITGNAKTLVRYDGPATQVRAQISGYVDGLYSVSVDAL
jgi:hypothetical protein